MEEGREGTKNVLELSEIGSLLDGLKLGNTFLGTYLR
jgi:hypothetical protein